MFEPNVMDVYVTKIRTILNYDWLIGIRIFTNLKKNFIIVYEICLLMIVIIYYYCGIKKIISSINIGKKRL